MTNSLKCVVLERSIASLTIQTTSHLRKIASSAEAKRILLVAGRFMVQSSYATIVIGRKCRKTNLIY